MDASHEVFAEGEDNGHRVTAGLGPEESASAEVEPRWQQVERLINELVPRCSRAEWDRRIQLEADYIDGELGADELEAYIGDAEQDERERREQIAAMLKASAIPDEQLPAYVAASCEAALTLAPDGLGIDIGCVEDVVRASPSLEMAEVYRHLAERWREECLTSDDAQTQLARVRDFQQLVLGLSRVERLPKQAPPPVEQIEPWLEPLVQVYGRSYADNWVGDSVVAANVRNRFAGDVLRGIATPEGLHDALNHLDLIQAGEEQAGRDPDGASFFARAVDEYGRRFGFSDAAVAGLKGKLLPAILARDPQVELLLHPLREPGGAGGMFVERAYAAEVSPPQLNSLIAYYKRIPTSDFGQYEQNRLDGLTLAQRPEFGRFRDALHREELDVHEMVQAMIAFAKTGDHAALEPFRDRLGPGVFERGLYMGPIRRYITEMKVSSQAVELVRVLEELERNTRRMDVPPPQTSDRRLNELMGRFHKAGREEDRQTALGEGLQYVNDGLVQQMEGREVGVEPMTVAAYAWLDREVFKVLRDLNFEDQTRAYKQPWFAQVMRFHELTGSAEPFDEKAFEEFMAAVVQGSDYQHAYRTIFSRTLHQVEELSKTYQKTEPSMPRGMLWTGNTAHGLLDLIDLKPAVTTVGRRLRKELQGPEYERRTGD